MVKLQLIHNLIVDEVEQITSCGPSSIVASSFVAINKLEPTVAK